VNPTKILIVDDHELITGSLELMLGDIPEISECRIAGSLGASRKLLQTYCPDLILLDISLPDGSGLELLDDLGNSQPQCKIMLMSGHYTPSQLVQLTRLNVRGIFSKTDSVEQLQEGVTCLLDGDNYLSSHVSDMLNNARTDLALTPRQLEVLQLVATGLSNKSIAERTSLSASTVAFHLRELRIRLGVQTTREAVKLAHERSLL